MFRLPNTNIQRSGPAGLLLQGFRDWGVSFLGGGEDEPLSSQRLQYPLVEEYTLNLIRVPIIV